MTQNNKAPFLDVDGIYPVLKVHYPGGRPTMLVAVTDTFRCYDNRFLIEGRWLGTEYLDGEQDLIDTETIPSYFALGEVPMEALDKGEFHVR